MTREELSGMLYDSLNNKIKNLPDEVLVYPAHGPGSSCGKNIGKETWSTIGDQKKSNYALRNQTKAEFIKSVTEGLLPPPAYFFDDARINKEGYENIDSVINRNKKPLTTEAFQKKIESGTVILDTRNGIDFENGFIKDSINIGLNGMFAIWVGTVIDMRKPLLLVCENGKEEETITRLARVGFENVIGYLEGGIDAWKKAGLPLEKIKSVQPAELATAVKSGATVLDVRKFSEAENGHIKNAIVIPLAELDKNASVIPNDEPVYVHCAGGYRSMIATSLLKSKGFNNVINVHDGWNKIKNTEVPIETGSPANVVNE
jgi:rhodanese-related sulfurtransferase